jgi:sulfate adenylyltransferase
MADPGEVDKIIASCNHSVELNERQLCDVESISNGSFSPLTGFMNEEEYDSVVSDMRLKSGLLFGLPVVLDTDCPKCVPGSKVLLTKDGKPIAAMDIESRWTPDKPLEALKCYRTSSLEHPGVRMISMERKHEYIGGAVTGLAKPERVFPCETPSEVRARLPSDKDVVAFQCRNPVHRAHYELFMRALDAPNVQPDSTVLVHPTCGPTQEDDIPGLVRYHTYVVLKDQLNNDRVQWAYLPYSMHMAGPREAIQHMLIRKNFGCTHFIIGRDMAGSKSSIDGEDFYGAYDAQDFAKEHSEELGIKTVESLNLVCTEEGEYVTAESAKEAGLKVMKLSGTEFRRRLRAGEDIPEWFAFKSVVEVLREHQKTS